MTGIKEAAARDGFGLADIGYLLHGTPSPPTLCWSASSPRGRW
jgi:hypothetical protein